MEKKICIVANDNKYEAVYYETKELPLNCILEIPDGRTWNNDFFIFNTGVTVSWQDYYNSTGYKMLKATYKKQVLFEQNKVSKVQIVIDVLNKFSNMTKSELEKLLQESQEKKKTELEITIEELKAQKVELEEQMKIYKEIQTKKDEIKELLAKLE